MFEVKMGSRGWYVYKSDVNPRQDRYGLRDGTSETWANLNDQWDAMSRRGEDEYADRGARVYFGEDLHAAHAVADKLNLKERTNDV